MTEQMWCYQPDEDFTGKHAKVANPLGRRRLTMSLMRVNPLAQCAQPAVALPLASDEELAAAVDTESAPDHITARFLSSAIFLCCCW